MIQRIPGQRLRAPACLAVVLVLVAGVAIADHGGTTHMQLNLSSPATSSGSHTVTWDNPSSLPFELQEKVGSGAYTVAYAGTGTSYFVTGRSSGTYSYRIHYSFSFFGSISHFYTDAVVTTVSTGLATPSPITGPSTDDDGAFSLSWGSVSGATYYDIERRLNGGAWFSQIVIPASLVETGMGDGTWDYRVRACDVSSCSNWTALHTIVVTNTGPPPPPPPVPGSAGDPGANLESDQTGTTSGNFRVDESGSATYSIPIVTAAGTAGVAPQISLNYSSGGGNGIAGMGWSIGGMSAITRCKQTYDQDRNPLPITWTNADRYCLDGQRLLLENAAQTYGVADTTYRTEVDNGAIVTIKGSVNGEPDYFEVKRKDGSTTYYGKSPDDTSNVSAKSGGAAGQTFIWGIRHFKDNIGNPIWFDYYNDADGQRINTIYWAFGLGRGPVTGHGARLEFVYSDRDDDRTGYVAGVALSTKKRLSEIKSYNVIGMVSLIRQYNLVYNENITAADDISRLTSIQECAGVACLPKTVFDWRVPTASASLSQLSTRTLAESSDLSDLTLADVNGDGLMDLVWLEGAAANAIVNYAISDGTSLTQRVFSNGSLEYPLPNGGEKLTPIDYNLDGRYDIAYWNDSSSRWRVILSVPQTDGTWRLQSTYIQTPITDKEVTFVDIDSNGTTDAVWTVGTGTGPKQLKRSLLEIDPVQAGNPSSSVYYHFGTPVDIGSPSAVTTGNLHAVAADFDGDGRIGIIVGRDLPPCEYEFNPPQCFGIGYASAINILDSTSSAPTYSQYAHLNTLPLMLSNEHAKVSSVVVTDVNADGLSDLFYPVWRDPDEDINKFHLAINKGDGSFDVRQQYNTTLKSTGVQQAQFVDWNGDNHPDLVW